ncbi:MAG: ferritin-like domain-containing protein, partial [Dehalococcoidia bacterium]
AFERTGVRFYDALASKYEAYGGFDGGPSLDHIQHIWNEEFQHFKLLRECIEQLGGDSTAVTPAADIQATAGMGIGQVLTDPRTNLVQCLDAILVAELADNASWEALTILAQQAGQSDMAQQFEKAQQSEQEHVQMVKTWLSAAASVPGKRMAA